MDQKGRRSLAPKGLVRALFIVEALKLVKGPLLGGEVGPGRAGGFALEGPVHPFVGAILLGLAGKDPLVLDAEPDQVRKEIADGRVLLPAK